MFGERFFGKISNIIKSFQTNFLAHFIGVDYLSNSEQEYLKNQIGEESFEKLKKDIPYLDRIYIFGQIAEKLGVENSNKMSKKQFDKIVKKENIPNFKIDNEEVLDNTKKQIYLDILSKRFSIEKDIRQEILNQQERTQKGEKFDFKQLIKSLKEKLNIWSDLSNSVAFNSEDALNKGKADQIKEESGESDPWVYKVPLADERTCSSCKKAYLNSDGSPKIFKLSELEANGTNIGLKQVDWKPTLGGLHINCRCLLQYLNLIAGKTLEDYIWNGKLYVLKEKTEEEKKKEEEEGKRVKRTSKVKIKIGDKEFEV